MSCSVVSIPFALAQIVAAIIVENIESRNDLENTGNIDNDNFQQHYSIAPKQFIEREYETPFMDKEILIKTLEEHGVIDIEETLNGEITGKVDTFSLKFSKPSAEEPYKLKIFCQEGDSADEKVNDVSSEYALNVQEAA